MKVNEKSIHINAEVGDIAPLVVMPGDPLRAKRVAQLLLKDCKEVTNIRNMLGYTGYYNGVRVTIMSHGMGMPSLSIYLYELINFYKVKKVIRVGSCGVLDPSIKIPDIILADASYTISNFALSYSNEKKNIEYPDKELNATIIKTAEELNIPLHVGTIFTSDVFGPYVNRQNLLDKIPDKIHVVGEEMESFALLHLANKYHIQASCIVTCVDSEFVDYILTPEQRQNCLDDMFKIALESIIK